MKTATLKKLEKEWIVSGTITETNTHQPLKGLRVVVLDMDFILGDDFLGESLTDDEGKYMIKFGWDNFRDILEFLPDLYVKIYDIDGKLIKDTHAEVFRNVSSNKEINVEIDLGQKEESQEIGGFQINPKAFEKATIKDILGIAQIMRGRNIDKLNSEILFEINPQLSIKGIRESHNFCTTPFRQFIHQALTLKKADRMQWLELDSIFSLNYTGYSTNIYNTPNFTITYILNNGGTTSSDAVDPTDSTVNILLPGTSTIVGSTIGGNGIPNFVEKVGFWLEYALLKYVNAPYSLRNPASGGRIPVTIENEGGPNGHATPTAFFIHNSMNDDLIAAISCHELFHMVQFQYNAWLSAGEWAPGMTEGGAVLAEDTLFDNHNRYVVQASINNGTMLNPQNTLSNGNYRYELALFLKYITEQHSGRISMGDEPLIGVEAYTNLITRCDTEGFTTNAIKNALNDLPFYQDFYDFNYLDSARLDLTNSETTLGNFHLALYLKDLGDNIPDKRFDFKEDEESAIWDNIFIGSNLVNTLASVSITTDTNLSNSGNINLSGTVNTFSAKYYVIHPSVAVSTLRVNFTANGVYTKPIFQIIQINADGTVRDIHRSDKTNYQKTIANLQGGQFLDRIVLIVTGTDTSGTYALNISEVADSPDVMITKWDSPMGKEYMIDSYNWAWTWGSPDVWVDNEDDGIANSSVFFNQDNHLYVRLRNKGLAVANNVQVDFWYQDAAGGLNDAGWLPVRNISSTVESLTGVTIAPGAEYRGFVNWAPVPSGTSNHFCVKVIVTSPSGDSNTDNKRCTSNFGHVIMNTPYLDFPIRRTNFSRQTATIEQVIIPRIKNNIVVSELDSSLNKFTELKPGEVSISNQRLIQTKQKVFFAENKLFETPCNKGKLSKRRPDVNGYYEAPANILPPGAAKFDMITITHLKDGRVIGGYSYTVEIKEESKKIN